MGIVVITICNEFPKVNRYIFDQIDKFNAWKRTFGALWSSTLMESKVVKMKKVIKQGYILYYPY